MILSVEGNESSVAAEHPWNALSSICMTPSGMLMDGRALQLLNAFLPMRFSPLPQVIWIAAKALIAGGAVLISQHADSYGAPSACEEAGVPNVSYNGSTAAVAPETFLVSSRINWSPFYEFVVDAVKKADSPEKANIPANWCGGFKEGSVELSELGKNVAPNTQAKINEVKAKLENGSLKVFDTSKFTVKGAAPSEENMAPSTQWTFDYPEGTKFVKDGYYHESEYRSAPSFDVLIDGINDLGSVEAAQ